MCLARLTPTTKAPIVVGYQTKLKSSSNIGYYSPIVTTGIQLVGVWKDATDRAPSGYLSSGRCEESTDQYLAGFHVFHKLADARSWKGKHEIVCKVACRGFIEHGVQRFTGNRLAEVSIFEQIKIIKEV